MLNLFGNVIKNYGKMGFLMSLEGHILDTHLNNFNQSLGAY